ncbi:MAG: hypothetical protein KJT03_24595, partial [Verrucomicrobiae bacterium]|nr:hypothetical protein [Verrucomicrobiae bacterium]
PACRKIPVYVSSEFVLVVGGMGKINGAIATTHAMHVAGVERDNQLINIGMCGVVCDRFSVGQPLVVNKIREQSTGREVYPDMLHPLGLEEASLETCEKPVTADKRAQVQSEIVDMEAFGVFQAGIQYLATHQMLFLKVVSDSLDFSPQKFGQMIRSFDDSLEVCIPIIEHRFTLPGHGSPISSLDREVLRHVAVSLRLTESQKHRLNDAAMGYLIRGGTGLHFLEKRFKNFPQHKAERNRAFKGLVQELDHKSV